MERVRPLVQILPHARSLGSKTILLPVSSCYDNVTYRCQKNGAKRSMAAAKTHRRNSTGSECRDNTNDRLRKEHFLLPNSDQIDLNLLLQAVLDINEKLNDKPAEKSKLEDSTTGDCTTSKDDRESTKMDKDFDDTASRHSSVSSTSRTRPRSAVHLSESRRPRPLERKNMSFSNTTVDAIDRENQRLLKEITRTRGRPKSAQPKKLLSEPLRVQTSSEVNRYRFQRKVDMENQVSVLLIREGCIGLSIVFK